MADVYDDAKGGFRRVEVLTGPGRRRHWSVEEKARIVAESHAPGAVVSAVARRWQVCPQQVFGWRREARTGLLTLPADAATVSAPAFVPIIAETAAPVEAPPAAPAGPTIEVGIAGAVVRVAPGVDGAWLTAVLRAVRASASPA
jgi:transposase